MRAYGLFTVIPIGLMLSAAQAKTIAAHALPAAAKDSCGPSYTDIYDFQVGDVFQGQQTNSSWGAGQSASHLTQKYRIVSRETLAGGYRYHIEGLTRSYQTDYGLGPVKISPTRYGTVNEIWDFADSTARRALNACRDQVVRFPQFDGPYAAAGFAGRYQSYGSYFTRVGAPAEDTAFPLLGKPNSLKTLGGLGMGPPTGNLYTDSALKVASNDQIWAVYAAGLGLVRVNTTIFESGMNFELKGYIRNGITYGLVESDSAFEEPVALRITSPAERASSDMLRFTNAGPVYRTLGASIFRDLRGRAR